MNTKKPSFLSRLTGADDYDYFDDPKEGRDLTIQHEGGKNVSPEGASWNSEEPMGELAVDVYQTPDSIVIKAFIAGVQPQTIDVTITREMVTISGTRQDEREVDEDHYFQRELYWGSFSRTILLPEEVDVDMAEASERHGILMIRLPKVNKKRQAKLKVRSR